MERGSKRKAAALGSPATEPRSKRARTPDPSSKSNVQKVCSAFIDQLKRAVDKTGRAIASNFLELPERDEYPDYYETIELPLAIDTLEQKLNNNQYPDISAFESDVKRMINNAKKYNDSKSEIYADAERIRKNTFNFMSKHNPAYSTGNYTALPTPIPESAVTPVPARAVKKPGTTLRLNLGHRTPNQTSSEQQPGKATPETRDKSRSASAVDSATLRQDVKDISQNRFRGMTLQQAQATIMEELINYEDEDEMQIFTPFHILPSRTELPDYYQLITQPTSLKGVLKRTAGNHGRQGKTGVTDYKTWDEFESAVSFVWKNARTYNEDESSIFVLAGTFESKFKEALAAAKQVVEPPSTTIKLNMSSKTSTANNLKIKLGTAQKASPSPAAPSLPNGGVTVDEQALQRQRAHVQAGINGNIAQQHAGVNGVPATPKVESAAVNGTGPAQPNGVSSAGINGTMLPPSVPRPNSNSPFPGGQMAGQQYAATPQIIESRYRADGKSISDALYESISIATHPDISANSKSSPYKLEISPDARLMSQTITSSLPASLGSYMRLRPSLASALGPAGRPFKIFVTVNGARVQSSPTAASLNDQRHPVFDLRLQTGMNRVDFEVVAAAGGRVQAGRELEIERCGLLLHLLR